MIKQMANKQVVLILLLFLSGCSVTRTDISNDSYYSQYLGKRYIVLKDMDIPDPSNHRITKYFVVLPPGVGGPEICPIGTLSRGSVIEVVKIFKKYLSLMSLVCLD